MNAILNNKDEKLFDLELGITIDVSLDSNNGLFRRYHVGNNPVNIRDAFGLFEDDIFPGYDSGPDIAADSAFSGWLNGLVAETTNLYCEVVCHVVLGKGVSKMGHKMFELMGSSGNALEGLSTAFACNKICHYAKECIIENGAQKAMERARQKYEEYLQ